jgi:hypothetical protein
MHCAILQFYSTHHLTKYSQVHMCLVTPA